MAQIIDHVDALAREIGPRPAGTEEERQAALYIADQFQAEAGFSAVVEDFICSSNFTHTKAICGIVTIVVAILAMIIPAFAIPALILSIIAAALYCAESLGYPVLTQRLAHGASQNVVAQYVPGGSAEGRRRRKVILVAHYDSGRVEPALASALEKTNLPLPIIYMAGMIAVPVFLLIYLIGFAAAGRMPIVLMILTIIAVIICLIPVIIEVMRMSAKFNEGANDNASGVAVMLDVASAIGNGRISEADLASLGSDAVIYGEAAARKEDLVPEGAQLVYEASQIQTPEPAEQTADQRLASAKAAIAALTGTPVRQWNSDTVADNLVQVHEAPLTDPTHGDLMEQREETREAFAAVPAETIEEAEENAKIDASEAAAVAARFQASGDKALPDWFVAAQLKAKKPRQDGPVSRSRFADALDNAEAQAAGVVAAAPVVAATVPVIAPAIEEAPAVEPAPAEAEAAAPAADFAEAEPVEEPAPAAASKLPAFLDPWKTQAKTLEDRVEIESSTERVDVTGARIAPSGVVDINDGAYIEDPEEAEARQDQSFASLGTVEHRPVVLPDVASDDAEAADFSAQQYAPLSQTDEAGEVGVHSALSQVPAISTTPRTNEVAGLSPTRSGAMRSLRAKLPHLSGAMEPIDGEEVKVSSVSTVGSFVATGATGSFTPVGDELLENIDPDDIYVDDADDSDIEENYTETGAFAGPDYMEMPKSRAGGFFSRLGFGRKKKKEREIEETPQQWLDVDDSFDPRQEGKRRGGWESFQNESADYDDGYAADAADDFADDPYRDADLGETTEFAPIPSNGNGSFFADDFYDNYDEFDGYDESQDGKWRGGGFSRVALGRVDTKSSSDADAQATAEALSENIETPEEIKQIYQFRNPNFNTEVWFVALGAQVGLEDGMNAFMREHKADLRGAVVIDLQGLGAGALSMASDEGGLRKVVASSRLTRTVRKAEQASGIAVSDVKLTGKTSAASAAIQNGMQGIHLIGAENGAIALSGSAEDIADNIDEALLEDNAVFVTELVRAF